MLLQQKPKLAVWNKAAYYLCVAVYLAAMYIILQWVTISFLITTNGEIKWSEGWEELLVYWGLQ
jgi:hypothetical protein